MVTLRFLGHAALYLEGGGIKALVDPFLTGNPQASSDYRDFADVDYIFVTHGHGDHLGDTVAIARLSDAVVVSNFELSLYLGSRGVTCHSMHIGGSFAFPFGRVKMTPALHGSDIEEDGRLIPGGMPGGFLIEVDGKKIYHAGDTGLSMEMKLLADEKIDVAFLPIGGNFVMDEVDAARAAEFIGSDIVVPVHYDTFDLIKADPKLFAKLVPPSIDVKIMKSGEELVI